MQPRPTAKLVSHSARVNAGRASGSSTALVGTPRLRDVDSGGSGGDDGGGSGSVPDAPAAAFPMSWKKRARETTQAPGRPGRVAAQQARKSCVAMSAESRPLCTHTPCRLAWGGRGLFQFLKGGKKNGDADGDDVRKV